MEGGAIASTVCAFGAIERQSTGTAFEIQTQYIRTGSTCQLRQYEKCCSFLFVLGHFRIIHKRHAEILRSCSLRQQLRRYHQPLTGGIGYIIAPATGRKGQNDIIDLFPVVRREQRSIKVKSQSAALSDVRLWGKTAAFAAWPHVSHFLHRQRKVTICARVQSAPGLNVVSVVPLVMSSLTAHRTASA